MSFGLVGGPLGCLGVALLLVGTTPRIRVAGLVAIAAGCALLGAQIAPAAHRTAVALATFGIVAAGVPVALVLRRWPWLLAFAVLPAVPARLPIHLAGTGPHPGLPLYLPAAGAG